MRAAVGLCALVHLALLAGCPGNRAERKPGEKTAASTLYDRIGGVEKLRLVVDDFAANLASDPRIGRHFASTDFASFKRHWLAQLCALADGPCEYSGRPIGDVHRGRRITDADFSALVDDLARSLDRFGVEATLQGELLSKLAAMRAAIVDRSGASSAAQ